MTKCRPDVHTRSGRRYPHGTVSKLTTGAAPHLLSAGAVFDPIYGILNGPISIRKLGILRPRGCIEVEVVKWVLNSVKQVLKSVKHGLNSVNKALNSVKHGLNSVKQ